MGVSHKLPDSANLKMLYSMYIGLSALKITLPISVVFGVVAAKIHLIRKNELVALYSIGAQRTTVLMPFIIISTVIIFFFVSLQGVFFHDVEERAQGILKGKYFSSNSKDLFLKYDSSYVYIKDLSPILKKATNIEIYRVNNKELVSKTTGKKAFFINDSWLLYDVEIVNKPVVNGIQQEGISIQKLDTLKALSGFKPTVMDTVHEGKSTLSFVETIGAFALLHGQDISTERIRGVFYANYLVPFFAPLMVIIVFFTVPISVRFFNLALFSSAAVFITLAGWGVIFTSSQLATTGTLNPEIAVILPFVLLSIFVWKLFKKNQKIIR
ncbi:MAG: LptF/LptG family permease, partial [Campylobacterales bacterium]|nr:LptF/LptG family permease [Campylobacterales bacterium]